MSETPNEDVFGFKFRIGDVVQMKGTVLIVRNWLIERSIKYRVIERIMQECPGGIQRHYKCRPFSKGGAVYEMCTINEIEIEPTTAFTTTEDEAA